MAYEIIGTVHKIGMTESIATKSGGTLQKRTLVLKQRRFDQNTGQEFEPNFPTLDFSNRACAELDKFKIGDKVRVRFDIAGTKYNDKQTQEERYFTSLRGFRIELYVPQQQVQQAPPPQAYPPQGYPQQPYQGQPAYPPQGQQPYYPPQQPTQQAPAPYPPQQTGNREDGLPF